VLNRAPPLVVRSNRNEHVNGSVRKRYRELSSITLLQEQERVDRLVYVVARRILLDALFELVNISRGRVVLYPPRTK
jgi:hypothetical protein